MKTVVYTRAVSCMPGDECSTIEREQRIREYAVSHGVEITKVYMDAEETRTANDGFMQLLQDGVRRRFDHVLIDSVFAAGRDVTTAKYVLLGAFFPAGIHFTSVSDGFTSRGKTMEEVETYFKDAHYKLLGCRKAEKCAVLASPNGRRPPYGFRKENGALVVDESEAETVRWIFRMRLDGIGPEKIVETLEEAGVASPSGNCPWYKKRIREILRDRRYTEPEYGPVISPELFDEVQRRYPERASARELVCSRTPEQIQRDALEAALTVANAHAAKMAAYLTYMMTSDDAAREAFEHMSKELSRTIRETEGILTGCTAEAKSEKKH